MAKKNQLAKRDQQTPATQPGNLPATLSEGRHLPPEVQAAVSYVLNHTLVVRAVAETIMKDGVHFGIIPGTEKPTLYQAGAQALAVTFKLRPTFKVTERQLDGGHREFSIETTLVDAKGEFIAMGVGSCTTMESKYRYRGAEDFTDTGNLVPSSYWNIRNPKERERCLATVMEEMGAWGVRKVKGQWHIVKFPEERTLIENPNLADCYNTTLKIAKKRSFVDAVLNATGASDTFAQDLEDLDDNLSALQSATGLDLDGTGRGTKPAQGQTQQRQKPPTPETPAGVTKPAMGTLPDWRNVPVHIEKSRVYGKTLGELDVAAIKALKTGWLDKKDWTHPDNTREDRLLRKGIVSALAEDDLLGKKSAKAEPEPQSNRSPATATATPAPAESTPTETKPALDPKAEAGGAPEETSETDSLIQEIEHLLLSHEIELDDFMGELRKRNFLGDFAAATNLRELPGDWLPDMLAQLRGNAQTPSLLRQWGYIK